MTLPRVGEPIMDRPFGAIVFPLGGSPAVVWYGVTTAVKLRIVGALSAEWFAILERADAMTDKATGAERRDLEVLDVPAIVIAFPLDREPHNFITQPEHAGRIVDGLKPEWRALWKDLARLHDASRDRV